MGRLTAALLAGAGTFLVVAPAGAQPTSGTSVGGATAAPATQPDVTVQGPERLVCRLARRTGTRMRSNRVCRTVGQWEEAQQGRSQDEVLAEAADTLEALGEKVSTNCIGGLGGREHDTPLGPR